MYKTIIIFKKEITEDKLAELKNVIKDTFETDRRGIHFTEESSRKIILDGEKDAFIHMQVANIELSKMKKFTDNVTLWRWEDTVSPSENCDLLDIYELHEPSVKKRHIFEKDRPYRYETTIILKKNIPQNVTEQLSNLICKAFEENAKVTNVSHNPRKYVFRGSEDLFVPLQMANIELDRSELFRKNVKVWHWEDTQNSAETCELLQVYDSAMKR